MVPDPLTCSAVLTHHWLVRRRGGEKVLEAMAEIFPDAPVYTLVHDAAYEFEPGHRIVSSLLRCVPGASRRYPNLLPLFPLAAKAMRLPRVDLVLCSDAALAKAMSPARSSKMICYCHSPMRYVWEPELSRQYAMTLPKVLRPFWPALCAWLRRVDAHAAQRVDLFVANSRTVAERIRRAYKRDSIVIYPPVEIPEYSPASDREDFYLCVGHHVGYKRLDLAVEACTRLGRDLVVIGDGVEAARLQGTNGSQSRARFLGFQPDDVVHEYYRRARALLFPGEEDFGIVPVEAMAFGCPVVAFGRGGATESVLDGKTGVLFQTQSADSLADAIVRFEGMSFDPAELYRHASQFGRERFQRELREAINSVVDQSEMADQVV